MNMRKVNENFWNIMNWYYGRSTYIAITIIKEKNATLDLSSTTFIQQFHNSNLSNFFFTNNLRKLTKLIKNNKLEVQH